MTGSWSLKASSLVFLISVGNLPSIAAQVEVKPKPIGDLVTLEVTVTDDNDEPIPGLDGEQGNFELSIDGKPLPQNRWTLTSYQKSPTPTKLVILLDTSNSMEEGDDTGQKRKLGAILAIEKIQANFADQPVEVKLIPFGEDGDGCKNVPDSVPPPVAESLRSEKFLKLSDPALTEQVNRLKDQTFCTSTDLYNPLIETLEYLQEEKKQAIFQDEPPKMAFIVLSDGFHSHKRTCQDNTDEQLFNRLTETANQAKDIPIYTIGYGLSPSSLRQEMREILKVTNPPLDSQGFICQYQGHDKYQEITKKFIDHQRLQDISNLTDGGEYKTFASAAGVAEIMDKFVRTILGKYEIKYRQKPATEGQTNWVVVKLPRLKIESERTRVTLSNWSLKPMKLEVLRMVFLVGIGGVIVWIFVFMKWSKYLKDKQQRSPN